MAERASRRSHRQLVEYRVHFPFLFLRRHHHLWCGVCAVDSQGIQNQLHLHIRSRTAVLNYLLATLQHRLAFVRNTKRLSSSAARYFQVLLRTSNHPKRGSLHAKPT